MSGTSYRAPWSTILKLVTALGLTVLVGIPLMALGAAPPLSGPLVLLIVGAPLAIVLICLLYTVRGYELAGSELLIHRLLWPTRVPLDGLKSVDFDPVLLRGSWRTFGNGGLFSFSGWFRNKRFGNYRAYMTNHATAVILGFGDRTIVVSPERPRDFVAALERRLQLRSPGR